MKHARLIPPAVVLFALGGCVSLPPSPPGLAASAPAFSPERFFGGRTAGDGVLQVLASRPRTVRVLGAGRLEADETLVVMQQVREGDMPPRERSWRIRQVAPGRYAGTLSDAAGPVTGEVSGNMMRLRFRMKGGLAAEQRLFLQPDGRTVLNRMTIRKLGIAVATLAETIRKAD